MDQKQLAEIRARNEERRRLKAAATEGPWIVCCPPDGVRPKVFVTRKLGQGVPPKFYVAFLPEMAPNDGLADGQFIAHARNDEVEADVDVLLAEIERLKEKDSCI